MVCAADDTGTSRVTALIEAADAAGLTKVPSSLRNPRKTTTAGLGDLIRHAVTRGIKDFVIGIGGSATNDCGLGMMESLGARFFDEAGELVGGTGDDVKQVTRADLTELLKLTAGCRFRVACDVTNPLCDENGCSLVFGPQKGGTPDMLSEMDEAIGRFSRLIETEMGTEKAAEAPGAGAAGGLGFAFRTALGAELVSGTDLVLQTIGASKNLTDADLFITGEGRLDSQTARGKAPAGAARFLKRLNPKCVAVELCGSIGERPETIHALGIDAFFPIIGIPATEASAMDPETAKDNLRRTAAEAVRFFAAARAAAF
jgi:glycerate kinase